MNAMGVTMVGCESLMRCSSGRSNADDLSVAPNELIKKGLLHAPERGRFAFTVPAMRTFIAQP